MSEPEAPVRIGWDDPIPATRAIVAGLVLVHLATAVVEWWAGREGLVDGLLFDRDPRFRAAVGGKVAVLLSAEPWRLLTTTWLHADAVHLGVNAVAVGALGRLLEPWVGRLRTLAWFLAGGLGGATASVLAGVSRSDGASGAGFALLGATIALGLRARGRLDPDERRLVGPILWGFLGVNLALSFVLPFVDAAGHLGGLAVGIALGGLARVDGPPPWAGTPGRRLAEGVFAALCLLGAAAGWASLRA